jgi:hypothetical protein
MWDIETLHRTSGQLLAHPPAVHPRAYMRLTCELRTGPPAALECAEHFRFFIPGQLYSDDAGFSLYRERCPRVLSHHWQYLVPSSTCTTEGSCCSPPQSSRPQLRKPAAFATTTIDNTIGRVLCTSIASVYEASIVDLASTLQLQSLAPKRQLHKLLANTIYKLGLQWIESASCRNWTYRGN